MQTMPEVDVLIVGGGLVGASLARALAGSPLRIALAEAVPPADPGQPSFDDRSTALAPTSRRLFQALGRWSEIAPEAAPIRGIHVSDQGRFGVTRLRASDEGLETLGHVAPNRVLGRALAAGLETQANLHLYAPARVTEVEQSDAGVRVGLDGDAVPERIHARLVIAADGSRSRLRKRLGLALTERDYGQSGIVANVAPTRDHGGWAYERFTREGPLAVLPQTGGRCALVWTMNTERADAVMALDDDACLAQLQQAFGYRLGAFVRLGRRQAYPLQLLRMPRRVAGRVLFVGNAARTLHPVAGQGLNLALRDVAELAERLHAVACAGGDPGAAGVLHDYERARQADEGRVVALTDGLVRLFSNANPFLALGRNLGLLAMDLLPTLRREFAHQAMGRRARLPRLSRGLPLQMMVDDGTS